MPTESGLIVHQFPCLSDNYGYLLHDPASGETVCIDTPDADAYLAQAAARGWRITQIWNTHWHPDHAGGNAAIKAAREATGGSCSIHGPAEVADHFPLDHAVRGGDMLQIGDQRATVIDVGGHTRGHVAYHLPESRIAFVGDALFALGCGRMFEGTPQQFWASLQRLRGLPNDTMAYCAHEYTASNARFALHADPDNVVLQLYCADVEAARARHDPTVPFHMGREKQANPFLRADAEDLAARWGGTSAEETFATLRAAKDSFR